MVTEIALVMPEAIRPVHANGLTNEARYCISKTDALFMPDFMDISRAMDIVSRETMHTVVMHSAFGT